MEERKKGFIAIDHLPRFHYTMDNPLAAWYAYCVQKLLPCLVLSVRQAGSSDQLVGPFLDIFIKMPSPAKDKIPEIRDLSQQNAWTLIFVGDPKSNTAHLYPEYRGPFRPYLDEEECFAKDVEIAHSMCESLASLLGTANV